MPWLAIFDLKKVKGGDLKATQSCLESFPRATLFEIRSQLEAKISLLRETSYSNTASILDELITNYFYKIIHVEI